MADIVKQVIVARTDLNMRKGKLGAQVGHACMQFIFKDGVWEHNVSHSLMETRFDNEQIEWFKTGATKIVVGVGSEKELIDIIVKCRESGLNVHSVTDLGKTEFNGVPTMTCAAIGPHVEAKFAGITDNLKLL